MDSQEKILSPGGEGTCPGARAALKRLPDCPPANGKIVSPGETRGAGPPPDRFDSGAPTIPSLRAFSVIDRAPMSEPDVISIRGAKEHNL